MAKKKNRTTKKLSRSVRNRWRGIYYQGAFRSRIGLSSKNNWHIIDHTTLSKINIGVVEILWLEIHCPAAVVTVEFIKNYKNFPAYKKGIWDGKSHVVRFPDKKTCSHFRAHWWNRTT